MFRTQISCLREADEPCLQNSTELQASTRALQVTMRYACRRSPRAANPHRTNRGLHRPARTTDGCLPEQSNTLASVVTLIESTPGRPTPIRSQHPDADSLSRVAAPLDIDQAHGQTDRNLQVYDVDGVETN